MERTASIAAVSSTAELVVHGTASERVQSLRPRAKTAPQAPGPGLPISEPSVKTRFVCPLDDAFTQRERPKSPSLLGFSTLGFQD
jgi:hypothetical protein